MSAVDIAPAYTSEDLARDLDVGGAEISALDELRRRVEERNMHMNLVGPATLGDFWRRHVLDSAQLLHVEQGSTIWADVGAGAGFPGLVLAILLKRRPGARVHLIESMAKRVRFLEEVALALSLPVELHHARAEAVERPKGLEIVTARACAPLDRLLGYTHHLFGPGVRAVFLKGQAIDQEIKEAQLHWSFQHRLSPSLSDPSGRLLHVEGLRSRG